MPSRPISWPMVLLALALQSPHLPGADPSLSAHYTFDGNDPERVIDRSGHGFHGTIRGGAQRVPSPRGHALRFDGIDDVVDYGSNPGMAVRGPLTLAVWLRTDADIKSNTHRLIYGDTNGTVNRNLNLRIDYRNQLRYEWGDGQGNHDALLCPSDALDGSWRMLTVVCDPTDGTTTLYVDGLPYWQQPLHVVPTVTSFGRRLSGSWSWGHFRGDIDEIRLYSRALADSDIRELAGRAMPPAANDDALSVTAVPEAPSGNDVTISDMRLCFDADSETPTARCSTLVANGTADIVPVHATLLSGREVDTEKEWSLGAGRVTEIRAGAVPLERVFKSRNDLYFTNSTGEHRRLAVTVGGRRTRLLALNAPATCQPLTIAAEDLWGPDLREGAPTPVKMTVKANVAGSNLEADRIRVLLRSRREGQIVWRGDFPLGAAGIDIEIAADDLPWDAYDAAATWIDSEDRPRMQTRRLVTRLPSEAARILPLNNLVSELLNTHRHEPAISTHEAPRPKAGDVRLIPFMNPRDGWCWFDLKGPGRIELNRAHPPLILQAAKGQEKEAMRYLAAGRYDLTVRDAPATVRVHSVPAVIYNLHEATPRIGAFGKHTWGRISQSILPSCNIVESGRPYPEEMKQWRKQGRKWVCWIQTPGLGVSGHTVTIEEAHGAWRKNAGYSHPLVDGIQADEFVSSYSDDSYEAFARSMATLAEDAAYSGRLFIPFVTAIHHSPSARAFVRTVVEAGWPFSIERYLPEAETEEEAKQIIESGLINWCRGWEEAVPGTLRRAIITPMYAVLPYCTANALPTANFNVYLDMQLHALANDPLFFGVYGVQPYRSNYADPEMLRWMGRLLRHYCILGKRERLAQDPYELNHLKNPDFEKGLTDWTAQPAQPRSIDATTVDGLGTLQGRYPPSAKGNTCAVFTTHPNKPNTLTQTIQNLTPGRQYSVKCISVDYDDLLNGVSDKTAAPLSLQVHDATITHRGFHDIYHNVRGPKTFGPNNRLWLTYHWMVMRAESTQATLTISDWNSDGKPIRPIDAKTAFNFVEIQPFVAKQPR